MAINLLKGQIYHNKNKQELIVIHSVENNRVLVMSRNLTDDIWHRGCISPKFFEHADIEFVDAGYFELSHFTLKNFVKVIFLGNKEPMISLIGLLASLIFATSLIEVIQLTAPEKGKDIMIAILVALVMVIFRSFQKVYLNATDPLNSFSEMEYNDNFLKIYKEGWNESRT